MRILGILSTLTPFPSLLAPWPPSQPPPRAGEERSQGGPAVGKGRRGPALPCAVATYLAVNLEMAYVAVFGS